MLSTHLSNTQVWVCADVILVFHDLFLSWNSYAVTLNLLEGSVKNSDEFHVQENLLDPFLIITEHWLIHIVGEL